MEFISNKSDRVSGEYEDLADVYHEIDDLPPLPVLPSIYLSPKLPEGNHFNLKVP